MRRLLPSAALAAILACSAVAAAPEAVAKDKLVIYRNAPTTFASLPAGAAHPEGIAANPATGEIYVSTFDFGPKNWMLRYDRTGRLVAKRDFGSTPLLGLALDDANQQVYVANFGAAQIQRIPAGFDQSSPIVTVANVPGGPGSQAPNAFALQGGDLYFSDSFQGAIFRIRNVATCSTPCAVDLVVQHPLLTTTGFPPFGANGLAFSGPGTLFVANTGDDRILKVDLGALPAPGAVTIFAQSINGADGIIFDDAGRLWVAANQSDEVVALSETGRVVAVLGEFQGINANGSPDGLLFPASLAILDGEMFVTNLSLALTGGDEPEADVTRFTVSRMKIPKRQ